MPMIHARDAPKGTGGAGAGPLARLFHASAAAIARNKPFTTTNSTSLVWNIVQCPAGRAISPGMAALVKSDRRVGIRTFKSQNIIPCFLQEGWFYPHNCTLICYSESQACTSGCATLYKASLTMSTGSAFVLPKPLKAIVFDVDGTLYRQSPVRRGMLVRLGME